MQRIYGLPNAMMRWGLACGTITLDKVAAMLNIADITTRPLTCQLFLTFEPKEPTIASIGPNGRVRIRPHGRVRRRAAPSQAVMLANEYT